MYTFTANGRNKINQRLFIYNKTKQCIYDITTNVRNFVKVIDSTTVYSVVKPLMLNITCFKEKKIYMFTKTIHKIDKRIIGNCNIKYSNKIFLK